MSIYDDKDMYKTQSWQDRSTNTDLCILETNRYLGRKTRPWPRTSLLRRVSRVSRWVTRMVPWVAGVSLLSWVAGVAWVATSVLGSWGALQHSQ